MSKRIKVEQHGFTAFSWFAAWLFTIGFLHLPFFWKGITGWKKLLIKDGTARIEFKPITGRTHQLRVHSASKHGLGIPIVGDPLYGTGTGPGLMKLHACYLSFAHPRTGESLEFNSDPLF